MNIKPRTMKIKVTNEARRKFLRKTAAYTGAGIIASTIPIHAKAYVAGKGDITVALVVEDEERVLQHKPYKQMLM